MCRTLQPISDVKATVAFSRSLFGFFRDDISNARIKLFFNSNCCIEYLKDCGK